MASLYCLPCLPVMEDDGIPWGDEFDFWAPPEGAEPLSPEEWQRQFEAVTKLLYDIHYQIVTKAILDECVAHDESEVK